MVNISYGRKTFMLPLNYFMPLPPVKLEDQRKANRTVDPSLQRSVVNIHDCLFVGAAPGVTAAVSGCPGYGSHLVTLLAAGVPCSVVALRGNASEGHHCPDLKEEGAPPQKRACTTNG